MYAPYFWQTSYRSRWVLPPDTARTSHHFEKAAVGGPLMCRKRRYCRAVVKTTHEARSRTAVPTPSGTVAGDSRERRLSERTAIASGVLGSSCEVLGNGGDCMI